MNNMREQLLMTLVSTFMSLLTPDLLRKFADNVLDFIEEYVEGSKSTVDDALVLPICTLIRTAFNIKD